MAAEGAPSFVCVPDLAARSGEFVLEGDEAHYLARVVRVRPGERFTATDGAGLSATMEVLATGSELRVRELSRERRERTRGMELWCGAPEGDRADWLVEKLGELGVATLVPLQCARMKWERAEAKRARWERLALAALRQSRSCWRLGVSPPRTLAEALPGRPAEGSCWVCDPDGVPAGEAARGATLGHAIAAVGPSSGFEVAELKMLSENGFIAVNLGGSRLRTETAALAVAAVWAAADTR